MANFYAAFQELVRQEAILQDHGFTIVTDFKIQIDISSDVFEQQGSEAPVKKDQLETISEREDEDMEDKDMMEVEDKI